MNIIKKLIKKLIYTEHKIIARDDELVTILKVLDECDVHEFNIETCDWTGNTDWCVKFETHNVMWAYIVEELKKEGLDDHYVIRKMS